MKKKILVIDDHPDTMQMIELSLERLGYQVLGARNGREGIALAQAEQPHLILLDVMMPDMNGYEVCRAIRQHEQLAEVPVIMFSAKTEAADKLAGFNAGADDFLTKPTRPNELAERVQFLLNRNGDQPNMPLAFRPGGETTGIIVLIGARGGVGTTTAAINIAASLAAAGRETILADLDLVHGHVAGYLNEPVRQNIGQLFEMPVDEWPETIDAYLLDRTEHWQLLLSRSYLQEAPLLSEARVDRLMDLLANTGRTTVVDLGMQLGPPVLPALRRAGHLLLCLRPERAALDAARQLLPYLRQQRPVEETLHVVMFDYRMGAGLPRTAVENYIQYPLLDEVHIYGEDLAQAVNAGQALVEKHPHAPVSHRFQELAGRLVTVVD